MHAGGSSTTGPVVVEAWAEGAPAPLRVVVGDDGRAAVQRLDHVGARHLTLSRHDRVDAALARLVATLQLTGAPVLDVGSGSLGPAAALALLEPVLAPGDVHVDGHPWRRHVVGLHVRWLPVWPAPGLWEELRRAEREWAAPGGRLSWQREVVCRFDDVYAYAAVGDVREAFVVVGAFADEAEGVAAASGDALLLPAAGPV